MATASVSGYQPAHASPDRKRPPGTSLDKLLRVLDVLGMESDLSRIAADDLLGRKLEDARLTETRCRTLKRPKIP